MTEKGTAVVYLKGVSKRFGSVAALQDVDLVVTAGQIHGLLGENGAGKSTLMKILYGLYHPDDGEVYIEGRQVRMRSPQDSIHQGIGMVHQVSTLVPDFTALENIVLGTREGRFRFSLAPEREKITALSREFGLRFPLDRKVSRLTAGEKQKIEIVRALYRGARVLILDEPTTSLVESEFLQLLTSLKIFVERGVTVVFITHKIREVMAACDTVTVLRKGAVQGHLRKDEMSQNSLVKLMFMDRDIDVTESALPKVHRQEVTPSPEPVFVLRNAGTDTLSGVNIDVYGGEILGIAAVSGNGEKDLAELFINPQRVSAGSILFDGEDVCRESTVGMFRRGVFYTPEDRIREGILNEGSIMQNVLLGHHTEGLFTRPLHFINWPAVRSAADEAVQKFNVDTPSVDLAIRRLSGGNIQKTVLARAFMGSPRLLVTHNPTSGLDIATVEFIFSQLEESRRAGMAIVWVNEDLDELMILSDRIAVLHEGTLTGLFNRRDFDKLTIGACMLGETA